MENLTETEFRVPTRNEVSQINRTRKEIAFELGYADEYHFSSFF